MIRTTHLQKTIVGALLTVFLTLGLGINPQSAFAIDDGPQGAPVLVEGYSPGRLAAAGENLYYTEGSYGDTNLYVKTANGGTLLSNAPYFKSLEAFGSELYFVKSFETPRSDELWKTSGTEASTELVKSFFSFRDVELFQGAIYASQDTGMNSQELWKFDGQNATLIETENANMQGINILKAAGDYLYFSCMAGLCRTDGQLGNKEFISDKEPISRILLAGDKLVYGTINWDTYEYSTISLNTSTGQASLLASGYPSTVGYVEGKALFASDSEGSKTIMSVDSTGTLEIVMPGFAQVFSSTKIASGLIIEGVLSGENAGSLWWTDGTAAGTRLVADGLCFDNMSYSSCMSLAETTSAVYLSYGGYQSRALYTFGEALPPAIEVTYNYNGANSGNSITSSAFSPGGTAIELPSPNKTGYAFQGWFLDEALTSAIEGSSYSPTQPETLFAKWSQQFRVTFNYNGATGGNSIMTGTFTVGETEIALPVPSRTDFAFQGWFSDEALTNPIAGSSYAPTQAQALFAKWTALPAIRALALTSAQKKKLTVRYTSCTALRKVFPQGVAYSSTVSISRAFLRIAPPVSSSFYKLNSKLDTRKVKVVCGKY